MEYTILVKIISDALGINEAHITPKTEFKNDLGADSIELYHIIMCIEDEFGIEISEDSVSDVVTVGDAARLVKDSIAG